MRLTRAGEYAVRCLLYLAQQPAEATVKRRLIAEVMEIPYEFLGKVAQGLAKAGLVQVSQGARGGLKLARDPGTITLLEAIEAVEGEIFLNDCLAWPESCHRSTACAVHRVWERARTDLRGTLDSVSFLDLVRAEDDPECWIARLNAPPGVKLE